MGAVGRGDGGMECARIFHASYKMALGSFGGHSPFLKRLRRGITPEVYRYHRQKSVPRNVPFFLENMVKMCYIDGTARDRKSRGYRQLLTAQEVVVLGESRS